MRRCFYHTDLVQNAVFHNTSRQIAFIQYSGLSQAAQTQYVSLNEYINIHMDKLLPINLGA